MEPLLDLARARGLFVVEDCAQAAGALYRGRPVGSFGTIGCFSFHPLKTLNACGDGGILTTSDETLARRLRVLRNLGLESRNRCTVFSGNSRLDTVQAAILLVKLNLLEEWTERRRANAAFYQGALRGIPWLAVPEDRREERAVYHTFVVQADRRDELKEHLAGCGIETAIHYPVPIHLQEAAADLGCPAGSFPVAERQAKRILSLPVHQGLEREDLERIAGAIREFFGVIGGTTP